MRLRELISETTTAGGIATVSQPLLTMSRSGDNDIGNKYLKDLAPAMAKPKRKNSAHRQFKNSISN